MFKKTIWRSTYTPTQPHTHTHTHTHTPAGQTQSIGRQLVTSTLTLGASIYLLTLTTSQCPISILRLPWESGSIRKSSRSRWRLKSGEEPGLTEPLKAYGTDLFKGSSPTSKIPSLPQETQWLWKNWPGLQGSREDPGGSGERSVRCSLGFLCS